MQKLFNIFAGTIYFLQLPLAFLAMSLIKIYQYVISPYLGRNCRYTPTCSAYTYLSIKKFGIFKGGYYSAIRIVKCNPWGGFGLDPVKSK